MFCTDGPLNGRLISFTTQGVEWRSSNDFIAPRAFCWSCA